MQTRVTAGLDLHWWSRQSFLMLHSESNRRENLAKLRLRLQTHSWCSLELFIIMEKMKSSKVVLYLHSCTVSFCVFVWFFYIFHSSFFYFLGATFLLFLSFLSYTFSFLRVDLSVAALKSWVTKYQNNFFKPDYYYQFASPNSKKIVRMLLQTRTSNYSFNYLEQELAWGNWLTQSHQEKVCHLSSNKKFSMFFTDNQLYAYFYSQ